MATPQITRKLQVVLLSVLLIGCGGFGCADLLAPHPHAHDTSLGSIDLSVRGAKCESDFRWNSHIPGLSLTLSDTNGAARPIGSSPDWPLAIQVDAVDKSDGKLVASSHVAHSRIVIANWYLPATCLLLRTPEFDVLQASHSYKIILTVLQEDKSLGSAKVQMHWITGGDSM